MVHRWLPKMAFNTLSLQHMSFGVQLYGNPLDFDVPDSIMTTYKDLLKKPNFGKRRKIN